MTIIKYTPEDFPSDLTHLDPVPSYEESVAAPAAPPRLAGPRPGSLQILGATWGGINATAQIQSMISDSGDKLPLDMRSLWKALSPDPASGTVKVLTILYRFDDEKDSGETHLLTVPEGEHPGSFTVNKSTAFAHSGGGAVRGANRFVATLSQQQQQAWPAASALEPPHRDGPQVEILAVVYGLRRIETPAVLAELAAFFEGRKDQVRMTNAFFKTDPWPYRRKSWTVYFRFVGGSKRVQVVTGWEDGALEAPWSRY